MAVGAVSSAQTQNSPASLAQVMPAPTALLRSGESVATSLAALTSAGSKTYRHMVPGAKFHMPDGLELVFLGGTFTTSDPAIIDQLDRVANRPASQIFSTEAARNAVTQLQKLASDDAAKDAKTETESK